MHLRAWHVPTDPFEEIPDPPRLTPTTQQEVSCPHGHEVYRSCDLLQHDGYVCRTCKTDYHGPPLCPQVHPGRQYPSEVGYGVADWIPPIEHNDETQRCPPT